MSIESEILERWLSAHLPLSAAATLVDVGAFQGDFAAAMLAEGAFGRAHLFEPNSRNVAALQARFQSDPRVVIHPVAVGAQVTEIDFFCSENLSTGSVLPYVDAVSVNRSRVAQTTLDTWWTAAGQPRVDLIKIDTQGADLHVLRGAAGLVAGTQPWLATEMIFIPRYNGQARPGDLLTWAEDRGYGWAGIFNEHRTATGLLAFADAVFAPAPAVAQAGPPFVARPFTTALQQEVNALRQVCAERLTLIEHLHAEAAKRLSIINELQRHQQP